jgi:hypothetical protein
MVICPGRRDQGSREVGHGYGGEDPQAILAKSFRDGLVPTEAEPAPQEGRD